MSKKLRFREKVYTYVTDRLREGNPPTIREVQTAMGFKAVETARSHLEALVEDGRLIKRGSTSRAYALPPGEWEFPPPRRIPVLGAVQAGALTWAQEEPEGFLETERSRMGEELFALRVRGNSMSGAGILPGDMVIARRQTSAHEGDIIIALVGEEATMKRLRRAGQQVVLWPENPEFEPILLPPEELNVLGKVIEVRRYIEHVPLVEGL